MGFTFLGDVRHQFIFPRTTLLDHIKTIGGSQISCTVTDIPQLSSTSDVTVSGTDGGVNAYADTSKSIADGTGSANLAQIDVFDKVTLDNGALQDIAEVNVGDRIRILHDVNDWAQWKTRTVDKVDLTAGTSTAVSAVSSFTVDLLTVPLRTPTSVPTTISVELPRNPAAPSVDCATSPAEPASASRDTLTTIALAKMPWLHK